MITSLLDHPEDSCRFLVGDVWCTEPAALGVSYCEEHSKIAYRKPAPRPKYVRPAKVEKTVFDRGSVVLEGAFGTD